ncbi:MAG: DUF58 domain-containing protein [Clostridium sp.]|nr:DUF58 domain-containing protein [Clostridium sp.]
MIVDLVYIFLLTLSYIFKYFVGGPIFRAVFYTMLIALFISLFYIICFLKNIDIEVSLDDNNFRVFKDINFKIKVTNRGILFAPFIKIIDESKAIDLFGVKGKDETVYNIEKYFDKRGKYEKKKFEILVKDPFNIFTFKKNAESPEIIIYPMRYDNLERFVSKDNKLNLGYLKYSNLYDIENIRKYNLGDDFRRINWSIFAKTGDMYIVESSQDSFKNVVIVTDMNLENNIYKVEDLNISINSTDNNPKDNEPKDIYRNPRDVYGTSGVIKSRKLNFTRDLVDIAKEDILNQTVEEHLVGFSISLSDYLLKKGITHKVETNNKTFKSLNMKNKADIQHLEDYMLGNYSEGDIPLNEYLEAKNKSLKGYKFIMLVVLDLKKLNLDMISKIYKHSNIIIFTFKRDEIRGDSLDKNITIYDIGEIVNEN